MSKFGKAYGYIKSNKDERDYKIKFTDDHIKKFHQKYKLTESSSLNLAQLYHLPEALSEIDQGGLGSCTANATAFAYAFDEIKQTNKECFLPSRLFIYYNSRLLEGTTETDSGASLRDAVKSIKIYGVCDEHYWIYDPLKFNIKPIHKAYEEAEKTKGITYLALNFDDCQTQNDICQVIKNALKSGFPIVFGCAIYESFESEEVASTGQVPIPDTNNEELMGGHALCIIGYDDIKSSFLIKNSWGPNWGIKGYCYMPYDYISDLDLCQDFWVIQAVANPTDITNYNPQDIYPDAVNLDVDMENGGVVNPNT
jgi:C1A family cysteine protease